MRAAPRLRVVGADGAADAARQFRGARRHCRWAAAEPRRRPTSSPLVASATSLAALVQAAPRVCPAAVCSCVSVLAAPLIPPCVNHCRAAAPRNATRPLFAPVCLARGINSGGVVGRGPRDAKSSFSWISLCGACRVCVLVRGATAYCMPGLPRKGIKANRVHMNIPSYRPRRYVWEYERRG